MPDPNMDVLWQRYTLSTQQMPQEGSPATSPPGLYRDSFGDTWVKMGDGRILRLGDGAVFPEPPEPEVLLVEETGGGGTATKQFQIASGSTVVSVLAENLVGWSGWASMNIGDDTNPTRYANQLQPGPNAGTILEVSPNQAYPTGGTFKVVTQTGGTGSPKGQTEVRVVLAEAS